MPHRLLPLAVRYSFQILSIVAGVSLVVAAGSLGWVIADRDIPLVITSEKLNRVTVPPGQFLERTVTYIQKKRCFIHSDRMLVDAKQVRHMLDPIEFQAGVGDVGVEQTYVIRVPIPGDMAPGPARFESTTVYKCNWVQWFWPLYSPYRPIFFEVASL